MNLCHDICFINIRFLLPVPFVVTRDPVYRKILSELKWKRKGKKNEKKDKKEEERIFERKDFFWWGSRPNFSNDNCDNIICVIYRSCMVLVRSYC